MANITLTFTDEIPFGVQIRDIAWYLDTSETTEVEMGPITAINGNQITVDNYTIPIGQTYRQSVLNALNL